MDVFDILPLISTVLSAAILALAKSMGNKALEKTQKAFDMVDANNEATLSMLRDRILQSCRLHQEAGEIGAHDAEVLQDMATAYFRLGGNGFIHAQVEKTLALPLGGNDELDGLA